MNTTYVDKVEAALRQISSAPELNTFITLDAEGALEQAAALDTSNSGQELALKGMLITVKDNIAVAGLPITGGTPALRHFRAAKEYVGSKCGVR